MFCPGQFSGEGGIWELLAAAGDGHATHRKRDLDGEAAASTTVVSEPVTQTASQSSYKGWYSFKVSMNVYSYQSTKKKGGGSKIL